jgi:DNA polymerase
MLAWLAGEAWKTKAFADFDAGKGDDIYKLAYARAFDIDPRDVNGDQRQIGKVMELALGYQGGVGAFLTFATAYGMDLGKMSAAALPKIPSPLLHEAHGLTQEIFIACDSLKRLWREAHPRISSWWDNLQTCAVQAVRNPGVEYKARSVTIVRDGAWLKIKLPSGRFLSYPGVRVNDEGGLSYMGMNQYSRKWERIGTYGGKIAENITQAAARDIMAHAMPRAEDAGFEIVFTVHDELATESVSGTHEELSAILATNPPWAKGLPLAAKGFETLRYRKD